MLASSSEEDTDDEVVDEELLIYYQGKEQGANPVPSPSVSPSVHTPSPTLSVVSEATLVEQQEDDERKEKLQVYIFVLRCIAYPFNARQPTDMARRHARVSRQNLQKINDRFADFLKGDSKIAYDEAFYNAVKAYFDIFICSERVLKMVNSGGCSANDFREVFKSMIEKRVRNLPEIDGLSKETVLSSWMAKFDAIYRGEDDLKKGARMGASAASELILSKEQLYEMFQTILGVKKYEHQILFNACQIGEASMNQVIEAVNDEEIADEFDPSSDEETETEEANGEDSLFQGEIGSSATFLIGVRSRFGRAVRFNNRFLS